MSVVLVPPPPRVSLVDERGNITRPWLLYFQDVFTRIGGAVAPSPQEMQAEIDAIDERATASALGVFGRQVIQPQEPEDLGRIMAFLPHIQSGPVDPDDANSVLCNRVFGVH